MQWRPLAAVGIAGMVVLPCMECHVPKVIDYSLVLERMKGEGYVCNYHNSGAFGFGRGVNTEVVAWTGPEDSTIREEAREFVQLVRRPWEENLAAMAMEAWRQWLPGEMWLMPKSHWAFELDLRGGSWLARKLEAAGIDPSKLAGLNNAAAIEFAADEREAARSMAEALLEHLSGSDFVIAFPGHPVICTLHHHKQLWWITTDARLAGHLRELGREWAMRE